MTPIESIDGNSVTTGQELYDELVQSREDTRPPNGSVVFQEPTESVGVPDSEKKTLFSRVVSPRIQSNF